MRTSSCPFMVEEHKVRVAPQAPPRFTATSSTILQDTQRLVEASRFLQDRIVATVTPEAATFDNAILPLAQAENARMFESNILNFYRFASASSELREASSSSSKMIEDFLVESRMREDVFALVDAVHTRQSNAAQPLDPESEHLLNRVYGEFIKNGLKLGKGPERDRLAEIQGRINAVAAEFAKNVADATTGGVWYAPGELPGMPDDVLTTMEKGTGAHEGKVLATFSKHQRTVLRHVTDRNSRKRMYIAHANRCNKNVPLFREVTVLRDEAARLLGYPSHAALSVEDKMARNTETVKSLLYGLRDSLMPGGLRELERYKKLKQADFDEEGTPWDGHYFYWDQPFYSRKLLAKAYQIDHEEIAQYFPLETTVSGMLDIFQHLFGLDFDELPTKAADESDGLVWHKDVRRFRVWDDETEGGSFLGYIYLDLFSRDFKASNASCFSLIPGFIRPDGTRNYPTTALLCSFPQPTSSEPCLLRHEDVVMLFHELGHAIHDVVSKTSYARFHGPMGTVVDFGEAPSQMLEHWCWIPSQLKSLSRHYSTLSAAHLKAWQDKAASAQGGENAVALKMPDTYIPDSMLDSLLKSKDVHQALSHLNQLSIALFDITIHEPKDHEAMEDMNISATFNRLKRETFPLESPWSLGEGDEWGHPYAEYRNFIGGDYHAGYYGYLMSQVYSADIFGTFFRSDPMNSAEGRRYRHELLEKGGSRPEMEILVAYLGRQPSPTAFNEELGLA